MRALGALVVHAVSSASCLFWSDARLCSDRHVRRPPEPRITHEVSEGVTRLNPGHRGRDVRSRAWPSRRRRPSSRSKTSRRTSLPRPGWCKAVDGVSYSVRSGETLGVVGESGCGKSVTALSILRLVANPPGRIVGGAIRFEGTQPARSQRARDGEHPRQRHLDDLPGADDLAQPAVHGRAADRRGDRRCTRGCRGATPCDQAVEMLRRVSHSASRSSARTAYPHQLSGGMRQRVMIAMALSCNPKVLIADEPTTALDVTIQAQILELMRELQQAYGMAIVLITHDMGVVAENADRVVVMYAGRKVEEAERRRSVRAARRIPTRAGLLGSIPHLDDAAQSRRGAHAPQRDQGHGALADRPAAGLQLRAALQPRHRPVPRGLSRRWSSTGPAHWVACWHADRLLRRRCRMTRTPASRRRPQRAAARGARPQEAVPDPSGACSRASPARCYAVDGVSFHIEPRRDAGAGRRERLRQVDGRAHAAEAARADRGTIRVDGEDITGLDAEAMLPYRRRMQMIYQDPYASLNPRMSAGEIVGEPLIIHGVGAAAGAARARGLPVRARRPAAGADARLSARVLRRPAPAHRHRPRARAQPGADRRRRAGLRARRLDPGADHQPADGPAGRVSSSPTCSSRTTSPWSSTSATASPSCISAASSR